MAINNQPDNLNLLQTVAFETNFTRIPNSSYFCQRVSIPGMVVGSALQTTSFSDVPVEVKDNKGWYKDDSKRQIK